MTFDRAMATLYRLDEISLDTETIGRETYRLLKLRKKIESEIADHERFINWFKQVRKSRYLKATYFRKRKDKDITEEERVRWLRQKSLSREYLEFRLMGKLREAKEVYGEVKKELSALTSNQSKFKESLYHANNYLATVQVGNHDTQIILRPKDIDVPRFRQYLRTRKRVCIHNSAFDLTQLRAHLGIQWDYRNVWDTKIVETWLRNGKLQERTGYKHCVLRYFGVELEKESAVSNWLDELSPKQIEYAKNDVKYGVQMSHIQQKLVNKLRLQECINLEFAVIPSVVEMQINGMYLDMASVAQLEKEYSERMAAAESRLISEAGDGLNVNSNQQLLAYLNEKYKLEITSTGEKVLRRHMDIEFVATLLEYRKYKKLLSTYIEPFKRHSIPYQGNINKIYAFFNQCGAETGRFSSGGKQDE